MELLNRIEAYLRETKMTPTRFGRDAVNDPQFVAQLRRGRRPGGRVIARIDGFLAARHAR